MIGQVIRAMKVDQNAKKWPPNENEKQKLDLKQGDIFVLENITPYYSTQYYNYTDTDIHIQMVKISHGCQWI